MTNHTDQPFASFDQIEEYFKAHTNYERMRDFKYTRDAFDLERVREVLKRLGNPHETSPIIHVAGTKGKGSTSAMISAILQQLGLRVGLFSKPHLESIHERVSINNIDSTDNHWIDCMNVMYPHLELLRKRDNPFTFFDIVSVLALYHFTREAVDLVVLEVGLGGRLDSTNVVTPAVSVITSIDYEHTQILGDTLEKIAAEKAGIIKSGVPVVSGVRESGPAEVIAEKAASQDSRLYQIDRDFSLKMSPEHTFDVQTQNQIYDNLQMNNLGEHQKLNATIAIQACEMFCDQQGTELNAESVRLGLEQLKLRGRVEVLCSDPVIILDVAHNPSSMRALREAISDAFHERKVHFLVGMSEDKDITGNLKEIMPVAKRIIFTSLDSPTGCEPEELRESATTLVQSYDVELTVEPDAQTALKLLVSDLPSSSIACITGSFYLAGEMSKSIRALEICNEKGKNDTYH